MEFKEYLLASTALMGLAHTTRAAPISSDQSELQQQTFELAEIAPASSAQYTDKSGFVEQSLFSATTNANTKRDTTTTTQNDNTKVPREAARTWQMADDSPEMASFVRNWPEAVFHMNAEHADEPEAGERLEERDEDEDGAQEGGAAVAERSLHHTDGEHKMSDFTNDSRLTWTGGSSDHCFRGVM